jgi:hypothetical protein
MKQLYIWSHKVIDYGNAGEEAFCGTKEDCENWIRKNQQILSDQEIQYVLQELEEPLYAYIDLNTGIVTTEDELDEE